MTYKVSFLFKDIIWKIHIDTHTDHLALEIRDALTWNTTFAWADLPNAQICWQDFSLPENWWIGLIGVYDHIMLFHEFPDIQKPEPKGICALHTKTQEIIWKLPDYQLHHQSKDLLIGQYRKNPQEFEHQQIDLYTGKTSPCTEDLVLQNNGKAKQDFFLYPQQYRQGTPYFETVAKFLKQQIQQEVIQAVDYLEFENYIIINYFWQNNRNIQNNLLILDDNVRILLNKKLNDHIEGISLDSFFIYKNYLILISNKCQLEIYCL